MRTPARSSPTLTLLVSPRRTGPPSGAERRAARDAELLAEAHAGSAAAWAELVDRHVADVWAWSVEAVGLDAAPAVCGGVWLRLAQALPLWPVDGLEAWLREAVRRHAVPPGAVRSGIALVERDGTAGTPRATTLPRPTRSGQTAQGRLARCGCSSVAPEDR